MKRQTIKILSTILLSLIILFGCKKPKGNDELKLIDSTHKNNKYDTIYPLSYYPVYPGSFWTYLINDSSIEKDVVSETYLPHSFRYTTNFVFDTIQQKNILTDFYTDTVYVPFLNGKPIYGYNKIECETFFVGVPYVKWPILSEKVGFIYDEKFYDSRFPMYDHEKLIVKTKIKEGNDSIIIIEGHFWGGVFPETKEPNFSRKSIRLYKKFIGLTTHLIIDTITNDTLYKKVLIDYNINKK